MIPIQKIYQEYKLKNIDIGYKYRYKKYKQNYLIVMLLGALMKKA